MSKKNVKEENFKKKMDIYLSELIKHRDKSKERKEYAIKQFDTLMIGLSTAGLGFVMNYLKNINNTDLTLALISQLLFLGCLLTNLFSHIFSMFANENALENAIKSLDKENYDDLNEEETIEFYLSQQIRVKKMKLYGSIVKIMNIIAFLMLLSAIILFVIFTSITSLV